MTRFVMPLALGVALAAPVEALQSGEPQGSPPPTAAAGPTSPGGWREALKHSLVLATIEHTLRIAVQAETRSELAGPFFSDYVRSLHMPEGWADNNSWLLNYVGHPIHGASAGYLWRDAQGRVPSTALGFSADYWKRIGTSGLWITAYSLQFEFGPLSEASIGNVGMDPGHRGWVDHVITPLGGMGLMVAEDAVDKHFLRSFESRVSNHALRATFRILFNPGRSIANLAQGNVPWRRVDRLP